MCIRDRNQTLATITLQNYFRLYDKLSGMTGTAMTEDAEFRQIYKLPVMAIPPNRPVIRVDENDLVYRTIDGKFNAVADDIAARHAKGQPCLIGTVSIENSEKLSRLLDKRGIKHETLNAKHHEREAHIAVSYTHLDVYKRQTRRSSLPSPFPAARAFWPRATSRRSIRA